jgi:hypothetical protein
MKDLMIVLNAIQRAQRELALYRGSGQRDPQETINRLLGILQNGEVVAATEKVCGNVASPSIVADLTPEQERALTGR